MAVHTSAQRRSLGMRSAAVSRLCASGSNSTTRQGGPPTSARPTSTCLWSSTQSIRCASVGIPSLHVHTSHRPRVLSDSRTQRSYIISVSSMCGISGKQIVIHQWSESCDCSDTFTGGGGYEGGGAILGEQVSGSADLAPQCLMATCTAAKLCNRHFEARAQEVDPCIEMQTSADPVSLLRTGSW